MVTSISLFPVVFSEHFSCLCSEVFSPDLPTNEVPAHQFLKSIHNITIERGWLPMWLQCQALLGWWQWCLQPNKFSPLVMYLLKKPVMTLMSCNFAVSLHNGFGPHRSKTNLMSSVTDSTAIQFILTRTRLYHQVCLQMWHMPCMQTLGAWTASKLLIWMSFEHLRRSLVERPSFDLYQQTLLAFVKMSMHHWISPNWCLLMSGLFFSAMLPLVFPHENNC